MHQRQPFDELFFNWLNFRHPIGNCLGTPSYIIIRQPSRRGTRKELIIYIRNETFTLSLVVIASNDHLASNELCSQHQSNLKNKLQTMQETIEKIVRITCSNTWKPHNNRRDVLQAMHAVSLSICRWCVWMQTPQIVIIELQSNRGGWYLCLHLFQLNAKANEIFVQLMRSCFLLEIYFNKRVEYHRCTTDIIDWCNHSFNSLTTSHCTWKNELVTNLNPHNLHTYN